jgi:hypothetical protein
MLSVSPADALSKARVFLILGAILFGIMHVLALVAGGVDARWRAKQRASIFSPAMGFQGREGGVWLWLLRLDEGEKASGPAVAFAHAVGLPLVRLQLAIPEEMLNFAHSPDDGGLDALITSTALVFALLQHQCLLPREEVSVALAEAAQHFHSSTSQLAFRPSGGSRPVSRAASER